MVEYCSIAIWPNSFDLARISCFSASARSMPALSSRFMACSFSSSFRLASKKKYFDSSQYSSPRRKKRLGFSFLSGLNSMIFLRSSISSRRLDAADSSRPRRTLS